MSTSVRLLYLPLLAFRLPTPTHDVLMSLAELRKLAWAGIPVDFRPLAWQLLLVRFTSPATIHIPRE